MNNFEEVFKKEQLLELYNSLPEMLYRDRILKEEKNK